MSILGTDFSRLPEVRSAHEEPESLRSGGARTKVSVATGLAGLSMRWPRCPTGPRPIVLVLAVVGGAGLGFTVPVTLAIAALLAVLVASYRQVIAAFPCARSENGP
ncbi:hypothetical protein OPAG_06766 [Rhodococcus opacus PD630]|nr:hypothetical protein Pd630_LPD15025 [Rhodococcus opacus PD630]EHI43488.1 hypothetical protein OPAG_06766 [Rhodococcus opacus PD630]